MKDRIYVIKYKFYYGQGGKYGPPQDYEIKTEYFDKFERDDFIKLYLWLKEKIKTGVHYDDVLCYTVVLEEIEDMESVINAI